MKTGSAERKFMKAELPKGWSDTSESSLVWRRGVVFSWATGFTPPTWFQHTTEPAVSIRPGETGSQAYERERKAKLPENHYVFWVDQ